MKKSLVERRIKGELKASEKIKALLLLVLNYFA